MDRRKNAFFGLCLPVVLLGCMATVLAFPGPAWAQGGPSPATAPSADAAVTNGQVSAAIKKGLQFLLDRQKSDGRWQTPYAKQFQGAAEALAVLTAMAAGEKSDSKKLTTTLEYLGTVDPSTVYARSLRIMVYARLGSKYSERLTEDVNFLVGRQGKSGGWGYGVGHETTEFMPDWTDASNTQIAVLALRDAADAGAVVPPGVWRKCRSYWVSAQRTDGGWGYQALAEGAGLRAQSYPSMTAAGAASLQIIAARVAPMDASEEKPRQPVTLEDQGAIDKAMQYLADHYQPMREPFWPEGMTREWNNYYLFNLTRAALASGQRTLGSQKWFVQVPAMLLAKQREDGSWAASDANLDGQDVVTTCFAILCLCQSQPTVLINKLPMCDKDSLDAQNLSRWLSRATRRQAAWQSLAPATLAAAIDEAPVLYISGKGDGQFGSSLGEPIRRFVDNGGIVLVQPVAGDDKFLEAAQKYFTSLLPDLRVRKLEKGHPVLGMGKEVSPLPDVLCLGDGARTSVFFLKSDFSGAWHLNRLEEAVWAFNFAGNVVQYATESRSWPNRLEPKLAAAPTGGGTALTKIRVARVKYDGDWNVSPRALTRLGETLTAAVSVGIDQAQPVDLTGAVPRDVDLLWLTGTGTPRLDGKRMANLKKYLDDGGTIFIDPAKGEDAFVTQVTKLLEDTFGRSSVTRLPAAHSLLTGEFLDGIGCNVTSVDFTPELAKEQGPDHVPLIWGVHRNDRLAVIFCGMGVTCPLEGLPTLGCQGLTTPDARRLACNVLLYAMRPK